MQPTSPIPSVCLSPLFRAEPGRPQHASRIGSTLVLPLLRLPVSAAAIVLLSLSGWVAFGDTVFDPVRTFEVAGDWQSVAVSLGGRQVLSAFEGGPVTLWDVQTGDVLRTFDGGTGPVAFSPDERRVLTGGADHTAKLWDAQSGSLVRTFSGHTDTVTGVVFSADGRRVLTGGCDGTARLWDAPTGQAIYTLAHTNPVVSVAFSPDGRQVLTGEEDGPPRLWRADTGQLEGVVEGLLGPVAFGYDSEVIVVGGYRVSIAFSADRNLLLKRQAGGHGGSYSFTSELVEARTERSLRMLEAGRGVDREQFLSAPVAFAPDDRHILLAGLGGRAVLWDIGYLVDWLAGGRLNQPDAVTEPYGTFGFGYSWIGAGSLSEDGSRFVTAGYGGIFVRDAQSGEIIRRFGSGFSWWRLAISPDGRQAITAGWYLENEGMINERMHRCLCLWDADTGQLLHDFRSFDHGVVSLAFSPDGQQVLTIDYQDIGLYTARLWDVQSGAGLRTIISQSTAPIGSCAFSPDGHQVLIPGQWTGAYLRLWDANTGQVVRDFQGHTDFVASCAFSPDGRTVLSGSKDGTAKLWDRETGQLIRSVEASVEVLGYTDSVLAVAFSPDSKRFLTSCRYTVALWDVETGSRLASYPDHDAFVDHLGFLPDGLGVWTVDHAVRIWNLDTGALSRSIDEYSVGLDQTSAVLHPDGRHVMENAGGRPTLWETRSGRLVRRFEGRAFALSPDGARVLTGGPDNLARLWATDTGQLLRTLSGHTAQVMSVEFSPDGEQVLTGSADGTAKLWETATGQLRHTFEQHTPGKLGGSPVRGFSRDGRRVFTGPSWNGQTQEPLKVWDSVTGQLVHTYANGSAVFSGDMEHVSLFREDINQALVFEASTGEPVSTGHDEPGWRFLWDSYRLRDFARIANGDIETNRRVWEDLLWGFNARELGELSSDGKWVVSRDGRLLLDAQWGIPLRTFAVVGDSSIASFSPNGHFLLTINNDGLGQVWDLRDRLAGIRTSRVEGKFELRWGLGILQSAETVSGPWEDVPNAVSPFAGDVSGAAKFYRVKVEE